MIAVLIGQLAGLDLVFRAVDADPIRYMPDGSDLAKATTPQPVIEALSMARGGWITLYYLPSWTELHLGLHPWGDSQPTVHPESARVKFGYVSLTVNHLQVRDTASQILPPLFAASVHLADCLRAIYGYGDLDSVVESEDAPIRAVDLNGAGIPRLTAWSYYSDSFLDTIGTGRIKSVSLMRRKTGYGMEVVAKYLARKRARRRPKS